MDKEIIKQAVAATVAIGYTDGKSVPSWLGTGFMLPGGESALTCSHLFSEDKLEIEEKGNRKWLCAAMFWSSKEKSKLFRFKVLGLVKADPPNFGSTYWGLKDPDGHRRLDVAYLNLDVSEWHAELPGTAVPTLKVEEFCEAEIGDDVIITGFPSPSALIAQPDGTPNAIEPLAQFAKIAGILPNSNWPLPHFFALDKPIAFGSSGSPVIRATDGKVIGMVAALLPMLWKDRIIEVNGGDSEPLRNEVIYGVPTGISYAVPSNLFYGITTLPKGIGKFEIANRKRHPQ